ncbi:mitochondrial ribosomal protein L49 [Ptiloglossa arizonensis]|uniref:mitochondrial ribosomal protein L49 n=1 Tax=Ptiloglossa arizonensis TaxID=3350558 RepID=UPI003F9FC8C6
MAALRLFTRSKFPAIILRSSSQLEPQNYVSSIVSQVHKRWGTYKSSPLYDDSLQYTDYEITKDPQEWEYVERLLKLKVVPIPPLENKKFPSGWIAPTSKPKDHPYYVQRTKNYMQPVYLLNSFRGMRKVTLIRKIQGDIWLLESELTQYLKESTGKAIGVRVNELVGMIQFRGDYVSLVKKWLHSKGL